jgi:energy-coupling factor transport system permease protein
MSLHQLPRPLHPGAWWLWAAGLAVAASRTTNPLILLLIVAVAAYVVAARRTNAPWARAFRFYLIFGLVVIGLRVILRCIFGGDESSTSHVLARLPEVPLPDWAAGVRIGGRISVEGVLAATYDGLRLATLLCCVGAANTLANPKRALRMLPGALYELGMAVVVAVSAAPQLVESTQRIIRAQRLRGGIGRGRQALRTVVAPVIHDALDRSLALAAAMDSRGYGRRTDVSPTARRTTAGLLLAGLVGLCIGAYGLLAASDVPGLALPGIAGGVTLCVLGLSLGSRRVAHTEYRPDPWAWPEWLVVGSGVACATVLVVASNIDAVNVIPLLTPLRWPTLPWLAVVGVLLAALPAIAAPPISAATRRSARRSTPSASNSAASGGTGIAA